MYDPVENGKRLKALRDSLGMTMDYVADKCDILKSSYSQYESGERNPRDEVKVKLAKLFGVTVTDIFYP